MKVYKNVVSKVCSVRFVKILANFSEWNALKCKGKLCLHAKLLSVVTVLSQANKKPARAIVLVNDSIESTAGDFNAYCNSSF